MRGLYKGKLKWFSGINQRRNYVGAIVDQNVKNAPTQFTVPERSVDRKEAGYWDDIKNQRKFFVDTAKLLKYEKIEDLLKLTRRELITLGAGGLLAKYNGHMEALQTIFPEKNWDNFARVSQPNHFWDSKENQKQFLEYLYQQFNLKSLDDWYSVKIFDIKKSGGNGLLRKYKGSLWAALKEIYPEHYWDFSNLAIKPRNYWKSIENQRNFFDFVKNKYQIKSTFDWKERTEEIKKCGGKYFLETFYNDDIPLALATVYPEEDWNQVFWEEKDIQYRDWASLSTQRLFFDNLFKTLNFSSMDDWYSVNARIIIQHGGGSLLVYYNNSHIRALERVYPDYDWNIFLFDFKPKNIWDDVNNQRNFLDFVAKELNITRLEDWYTVGKSQIMQLKGGGLLNKYRGNFFKALQSIYPEYSFEILKSRTTKTTYWKSSKNVQNFVLNLMNEFTIQKKNDWYRISTSDFKSMGGTGLLYNNSLLHRKSKKDRKNSLLSVLKYVFPKQRWSENELKTNIKKSAQFHLYSYIRKLFPNFIIYENYKHPHLFFTSSIHHPMELDIFIPHLNLAIEYQGEQHYGDIGAFGSNSTIYRSLDHQKREMCKLRGIQLVAIPYWWNSSLSSLLSTLIPSIK